MDFGGAGQDWETSAELWVEGSQGWDRRCCVGDCTGVWSELCVRVCVHRGWVRSSLFSHFKGSRGYKRQMLELPDTPLRVQVTLFLCRTYRKSGVTSRLPLAVLSRDAQH